ncbi:hypothetical protein F5B22DRAFT_638771 [Xylaria bambusicola]|uniref:uncharacterized protein n=1 Tax=Xylaria bambusicola TaxID=326684 RepID=UPI0020081C5E|nr:uncharacterized protein F5B22DRAFT_638771 [Xylaria bambusicola]KAI0508404.1 hypothetical protein F5B22DRAFT_638771 [Xylaria bambusicola]
MVGFVEHFRKPKLPVLESPRNDSVVNRQFGFGPQNLAPPILRNFSYPTNVANTNSPLSTPTVWEEQPSTWDQLGEICNFSLNTRPCTRQDRTAGFEDPFFYTTDRTPYRRLVDIDENSNTESNIKTSIDHRPVVQKRQHRTSSHVEKGVPKDNGSKVPINQLVGYHVFPQKRNSTTKLRRSSLGHHKTSSSFDASRLLTRSGSLERPMSSSGIPLVDTRLARSTNETIEPSEHPAFPTGNITEGTLHSPEKATPVPYDLSDAYIISMDSPNSGDSAPGRHRIGPGSKELSEDRKCEDGASKSHKPRGKEGRKRWFSQLKEWISVSEPSTQALIKYKKETYHKAGIALNDPLANAKLHLPVASLPPEAIKPGGRGPEPEEVVLQKAIQRKKAQTGPSQGSQSITTHYSSTSTVTASTTKNGE